MDERTFARGFLPEEDPLWRLPEPFEAWEAVASELSKLLLTDHLRPTLEGLPPFPSAALRTEREQWRAASLLAYMSSLYVLGWEGAPLRQLPAVLAVPFQTVTAALGIPPILSYALQAMVNWRRIDPQGAVALGNLTLLQNFFGGLDEEWFVTLHINIEAVAGRALRVLQPAQTAVVQRDTVALEYYFGEIAATLETMYTLLGRMQERCDPNIYYRRVRPFMFGWKDNPALPDGLVYVAVESFGGRPQQFRGETGAQSGIIPALDAALGISHEFDEMRAYLLEMRDYMPRRDREFVGALERGPSVRKFVQESGQASLREAYNECIRQLAAFRGRHIEYAALYILKPAQGEERGEVGTGGTPFTLYLKKHIRETQAHYL